MVLGWFWNRRAEPVVQPKYSGSGGSEPLAEPPSCERYEGGSPARSGPGTSPSQQGAPTGSRFRPLKGNHRNHLFYRVPLVLSGNQRVSKAFVLCACSYDMPQRNMGTRPMLHSSHHAPRLPRSTTAARCQARAEASSQAPAHRGRWRAPVPTTPASKAPTRSRPRPRTSSDPESRRKGRRGGGLWGQG